MELNDVTIIGAGPAGVAASIQLRRSGIDPVIFEQDEIGGLLRNAYLVENYPGFPSGISGPELVKLLKQQVERFGITIYYEKVLKLDYIDNSFSVTTDRRTYSFRTAVMAAGAAPQKIPDLFISKSAENRVFYEVYAIKDSTGKKFTITGAGDAAFDYALNLSRKNEVTILNRSNLVRCLPLLAERAVNSSNITIEHNIQVKKVDKQNNQLKLTCLNLKHRTEEARETDFLLIAVGRTPRLNLLGDHLQKKYEELINRKKLFLIGDIKNENFRQTAISVGDGVKAAMQIYKELGVSQY